MDNLTPITREEMLMNDEPLTPITREEKILAGEDLNPVTRREYFLKKYRHAGGDVMVEELSVTANGTYTAPEGKAYSPVNVAVPLAEKSVTENGVYNASADSVAGYSKVNVNVPLPENAYLLKEASGSLVSFSDGADLPMPSFVCKIEAVQSGSGDPSPENIRPISGHTGVNAVVSPTQQASAGTTYAVSFQAEAGEVFGGYVDLVSGVLTVTHAGVNLGTMEWRYNPSDLNFFSNEFTNIKYNGNYGIAICENYFINNVTGSLMQDGGFKIQTNRVFVKDLRYSDATIFTNALNGVQLVYELETPITYQLTPTQIKSLVDDITNAWCDTGNVDIDYFAKEV